MVDLVGQPGNVHGPDSTINGGFISSIPSPFQISHLKEFQHPYMDKASCQILGSKNSWALTENPLCSGIPCFTCIKELLLDCLLMHQCAEGRLKELG